MQRKSVPVLCSAIILPFLAITSHAQQLTGTSHPDDPPTAGQMDHYVKPTQQVVSTPAYQNSFPATAAEPQLLPRDAAPGTPAPEPVSAPAVPGSQENVGTSLTARGSADAYDGQIVMEVPSVPHELHRGTLLHVRLREALNTATTPEGAVFTAELLDDAGQHGEVMLPAGSLIRGHVSAVHGGKRISGGAALHLRPETVSLPDGTLYRLNAQVTDLDSTQDLRVTDEGTIVLRSHPKEAVAVVGGVTGAAAVTGAVLGGGVGAAIGAVAGAGIATAVYLKREVQEVLPPNTNLIFALEEPLRVTPR